MREFLELINEYPITSLLVAWFIGFIFEFIHIYNTIAKFSYTQRYKYL